MVTVVLLRSVVALPVLSLCAPFPVACEVVHNLPCRDLTC